MLFASWQLFLPAFADQDFAWDMFSHHLQCPTLRAHARVADGPWQPLELGADFSGFASMSRVWVPGRVERYADLLCARLRREHALPVALTFETACRADRGAPLRPLVDPGRDFCR